MASTIKVNNIQNQCGANIVNKCSTTITLGASGDNITLACGATQSGFGRTGTVDWDTTAKTAGFTAVSGNGYFVNTTSGAITVTLPATPSAGDIVSIADYAGTAATNKITIARNGSNFEGGATDGEISVNRQSVTLIYVDATQGWVPTSENDSSFKGPLFVTATGGTVTCCGDYKIHTFTGPGTFTVTCAGNPAGSTTVDYLVVAGGAAGGFTDGGDGGAGGGGGGGFRESSGAASGCYSTSPLGACVSALPVTAQSYPITVGAGGTSPVSNPTNVPAKGSNSIFSTITSTGGGGGATNNVSVSGAPGGSGGGGGNSNPGANAPAGSGNTPPVNPPQGNPGGAGTSSEGGLGGGGGAGEAGVAGTPSSNGRGGAGVSTSISSSSIAYAGGGGGGGTNPACGGSGTGGAASPCGTGGAGADYNSPTPGTAGTTNRGGGGGGGGSGTGPDLGGNGGSGIVIIRYKYQ